MLAKNNRYVRMGSFARRTGLDLRDPRRLPDCILFTSAEDCFFDKLTEIILRNLGQFAEEIGSTAIGPSSRKREEKGSASVNFVPYRGRLLTQEQYLDVPTFLRRGKPAQT